MLLRKNKNYQRFISLIFWLLALKKADCFYLESKLRTQWELFHQGSDYFSNVIVPYVPMVKISDFQLIGIGSDFFNTNTIVPYVPMVKITDLQLSDINRIGHRVR